MLAPLVGALLAAPPPQSAQLAPHTIADDMDATHTGKVDLTIANQGLAHEQSAMHARTSAYLFGPNGGSDADYEAYLSAGNAASPEACNQPAFTEEFRANCQSRFVVGKQSGLEASLADCNWQADPQMVAGEAVVVTHAAPGATPNNGVPVNAPYSFERCFIADHTSRPGDTDALGHFEAVRIGPISTYGGKDWTSFNTYPFDFGAEWGASSGAHGQSAQRVLAIRESFAGSMSPDGRLLGYPPLHQHHFHVGELRELQWDLSSHAIITHGDDDCLSAVGGVGCTIRRNIPGYATLLRVPLQITNDVQDVRAADSDGLTSYLLFAVRGKVHDNTFRAFTEVRIAMPPANCVFGYFGTYLIPSGSITAYWKASHWLHTASVLHSYAHTHSQWTEGIWLWTGASASQLEMDGTGVSQSLPANMTRGDFDTARRQIAERASEVGASLVCGYERSDRLIDRVANTSELNDAYYRLAASCVPFKMTEGEPFVMLAFHAPDSRGAAASLGGSDGHPEANVVAMHVFFRLFVNLQNDGIDLANCDQGCAFGVDLTNGATSASQTGCATLSADVNTPGAMCAKGTETLSPPSCLRNESDFERLEANYKSGDYAGSPRSWRP